MRVGKEKMRKERGKDLLGEKWKTLMWMMMMMG